MAELAGVPADIKRKRRSCTCSVVRRISTADTELSQRVPIGVGIALAHKYNENDFVSGTYFGDGAINQGQVGEALNMAALWDLPVIFVIENNKYAMGTSQERASAGTDLYNRGKLHGIPGKQVDGMDVLPFAKLQTAVVHCRTGKGPYVLEMQTYRYRGHSMSDPAKYRSRQEVSKVRSERDPIDRMRGWLIDEGFAEEDELKEIDRKIKDIVSDAAEFAQNSPEPDPSELYTDVLVEA